MQFRERLPGVEGTTADQRVAGCGLIRAELLIWPAHDASETYRALGERCRHDTRATYFIIRYSARAVSEVVSNQPRLTFKQMGAHHRKAAAAPDKRTG